MQTNSAAPTTFHFLFLAALAVFLSGAVGAFAQGGLRIQVTPRSGTVNDNFLMSVIVEGSQERPELKGGDGFRIEFVGPRTEVSIVNGSINSRTSYLYSLTPQKTGQLVTPSAELSNGAVRAEGVTITVSADQLKNTAASTEIILQQSVIPSTVYQGQQIINNIDLLYSVQIRQPQIENITYDDFWAEELSNQSFQRTVSGQRFNVLRLRHAIYPFKSGPVVIPSRRMTLAALGRNRRNSIFDNPFSNEFFSDFLGTMDFQQVTARSNSASLDVKPLPNPPSGFDPELVKTGITGETKIEAVLQPGEIRAGESKTLTITVKSLGNLNPLNDFKPLISGPARFYQENPDSKAFEDAGMITMVKTLKYSVVPTESGHITIDLPDLPWFDPLSGSWKKSSIPRLSFEALPSPSQPNGGLAGSSRDEARLATLPSPAPYESPSRSQEPQPRYEEPGTLENLSRKVSTGLALLVLAAFFSLAALCFLALKLRRGVSGKRRTIESVSQARNLSELLSSSETALMKIYKCPPGASLQALRLKIHSSKDDEASMYQVLSVIDEIELLKFGGQAQPTGDIGPLKSKILSALDSTLF